jgi:hypothetical protein
MADVLTLEHALMVGEEPLIVEDVREARKRLRLTRLAKEYVVDFSLVRACARAGLEWRDVRYAEREPFFIAIVQELVETIDPDLVMSRQEVLMAVKRIAFTATKDTDRLKALNDLARLLGMELPDPNKAQQAVPSINLTITNATITQALPSGPTINLL